jgi:hypothetical protein
MVKTMIGEIKGQKKHVLLHLGQNLHPREPKQSAGWKFAAILPSPTLKFRGWLTDLAI